MLTTTLLLRARGDAPAALAWERYADLDLWPTWSPHLRRAETDDGRRRLAAGLTGTVRGVGGVRARFVVDAVDASARAWRWTVRAGPARLVLDHGVLAEDDGTGSGTWLRLRGPAPLVLPYAPVARHALGRLVRRPDEANRVSGDH